MKSKNKLNVLIGFFIFVGFVISTPAIRGAVAQKTRSTIADKDTYINEAFPTSNYGGDINLYCGYGYLGYYIKETYFHFSFSDKPTNITKAELSLDIWAVTQTMVLTMCIIDVGWDEYTMDWLNKPAHGQLIGKFTVTSSRIYKIDLTSLLTPRVAISICVNISIDDYVDAVAYITSREGYYSSSDAPQIIWTYLATVSETPAIPSYSLFIIFGIMGLIGLFLTKKISSKEVLSY